jgi:hypothetical protein
MAWFRCLILSILLAAAALAQERISLPAAKTDADISVQLTPPPAKDAKIAVLPALDAHGVPLPFQPVVDDPKITGDELSFHLSDIFFWGDAKLQAGSPGGPRYTFLVHRGPVPASTEIHASTTRPGEVWLYNFETKPLSVKWRLLSGVETLCGFDGEGHLRHDCNGVAHWASATLGPARSDVIAFSVPPAWINPWKAFSDDYRQAQFEVAFGADDNAPVLRIPLKLHLDAHVSDAFWLWTPAGVASAGQILWRLMVVTFFVTLGAVLLMLAQVMIPNFRECMRMETEIERLQDRLRAISSRVGDRLYTRCHRELESVRVALAMGTRNIGFLNQDRLALAGNTAEVNRISTVLPRIESRIHLTEKLDECQSQTSLPDPGSVPPSFCWDRAQQLRNIQGVLSRQFITDADEKSAAASLELLDAPDDSMKDLAVELESRIAGLRRQLAAEPWKSRYKELIGGPNGCAELVESEPKLPPEGGWTTEELIIRDSCAIRLAIVVDMISLEALLARAPEVKALVLEKLKSTDPFELADARLELLKLSEGKSVQDVEAALKGGLWDTYYEPGTVTDQDVLRVSFVFRDKDLDRCTARQSFQCFWRIRTDDGRGEDNEVYEAGWEAQLISQRGDFTVTAQVYDSRGNEIPIRGAAKLKELDARRTTHFSGGDAEPAPPESGDSGEDKSQKGVFSLKVGPPPASTLRARLLRGLLDAAITAVVPVIAVAVTQVQNGGDLPIDKLVMLGFTSQAIRAAVVPEAEMKKAA